MNTTTPDKGGIVQLEATPAEGYAFSHWQAFGVDLGDYSSGETSGVITSDLATLRAYFVKQQSELVTKAQIVVGGPDDRIDISGTIPASLTRGIALDPKTPVRVIVGGKEFPFGAKAGTCTVLSYRRDLLYDERSSRRAFYPHSRLCERHMGIQCRGCRTAGEDPPGN